MINIRHISSLIIVLLAMVILSVPSSAVTYFTFEGSCQEPGQKVVVQGLNSTTPAQITHTPCAVTVYLHGTSTKATLFSDDFGTPLTNPFNSQSNGYFHYEVSAAGEYDYTMSNTTIGTPTTPQWASPFTVSGIQLGASGSSGGGAPGGNTNDVQTNSGSGSFNGTAGDFQYNPSTHQVTISGAGGVATTSPAANANFGMSAITVPNSVGTIASISSAFCAAGSGATAFATDASNGQNIFTCGLDGLFHQATGSLPAAPGNPGQILLNVAGGYGVQTGFYYDVPTAITHFPGGGSFDSNLPFSVGGTCPSSTPLGASSVGSALMGWDVGCVPKISFNGGPTLTVGLQTLIDYTYIKLDANNCFAIGPTTGDIGVARIATGVLGIIDCGSTSSPTKINIYKTFSSQINGEYLSLGFTNSGPSAGFFVGSEHGSSGGSYNPLLFGAAGASNPFWEITTTGPFICLVTNPSCDLGSITTSQQIRNMWQAGFLAENIIGPTYPVDVAGVQIGLVAAPTNSTPVKAATATTTSTSGTLGIVGFLSNGSITGATIVSGGAGYTAPTCAVTPPTNPASVAATCTTHQTAGVIDTVTITNTGANNGYQSIQGTVITINDLNGTGASILPIITSTTGFAGIAYTGSTLAPIFDGPVTIRHRIVISPTVNGELHDTGFSCSAYVPLSQQSYGCAQATNAGGAGISVLTQVNILPALNQVMLATVPSATNCPTAASIGAACKDTITLTPAQPDTNYVVHCSIPLITAGVPTVGPILTADKGLGSFKITVLAATAVAAQVTNWDCTVSHP